MQGASFYSSWNKGAIVMQFRATQHGSQVSLKYYTQLSNEWVDYPAQPTPDYASLVLVEKEGTTLSFDMRERFANFERRVDRAVKARVFAKWHVRLISDREFMSIYNRNALFLGFAKWVLNNDDSFTVKLQSSMSSNFLKRRFLCGTFEQWETFARRNKSLKMARLLVREEKDNKLKAARKQTKKKKGPRPCAEQPPVSNIPSAVQSLANVTLATQAESTGNAQTSVASALGCVVCFQNQSEFAVVPCGHRCLCDTCARTVESKCDSCPMCNGPIAMIIRIYG